MSLNPENETSRELNGSTSPSGAITHNKPVVVGIYGVSGCGKTYLMNQLKVELGQELFEFYEGSEVIDSLVPGGLEAFKKLDENKKQQWRELAIDTTGGETPKNRDANLAGPSLRKAHRQAGRYLATEFLSDIIGLEEFPIKHVQGHFTVGHRLLHEQQTLIVPLMRGGEPMAFGVNDAFPLATFLHAKSATDIEDRHLQGQFTIVLVDSVVNSGKSIIEFVQHIYNLHATIRIVVVAGVVQAQAISGALAHELVRHPKLSVVALRMSDNKFTGRGNTDTGNRLFNSTHLD